MSKYIVNISPERDNYYDWKDYVCEDFDENAVIYVDRYNDEYENASWWKDTDVLIRDIENCYDLGDFIDSFKGEYAKDKLEEIYNIYGDWDGRDKPEFYAKIAMILFPGLDLVVDGIRGYSQGDFAEVVYIKDSLDIDKLEDWFFGDVYDIRVYEISDEDYYEYMNEDGYIDDDDIKDLIWGAEDIEGALISYTELRHIQRDFGTEEQGFIEYFGLPKDADVTINTEDY